MLRFMLLLCLVITTALSLGCEKDSPLVVERPEGTLRTLSTTDRAHLHNEFLRLWNDVSAFDEVDSLTTTQVADICSTVVQELIDRELIEEIEFTNENVYEIYWMIIHWKTNEICDFTGETEPDFDNFVDYLYEEEYITEDEAADIYKLLNDTNFICTADSMETTLGEMSLAVRDSSYAFWNDAVVGLDEDKYAQIMAADMSGSISWGLIGSLALGPAGGVAGSGLGAGISSAAAYVFFEAANEFLESQYACDCPGCWDWVGNLPPPIPPR